VESQESGWSVRKLALAPGPRGPKSFAKTG
jgi:hypothetical protein